MAERHFTVDRVSEALLENWRKLVKAELPGGFSCLKPILRLGSEPTFRGLHS